MTCVLILHAEETGTETETLKVTAPPLDGYPWRMKPYNSGASLTFQYTAMSLIFLVLLSGIHAPLRIYGSNFGDNFSLSAVNIILF